MNDISLSLLMYIKEGCNFLITVLDIMEVLKLRLYKTKTIILSLTSEEFGRKFIPGLTLYRSLCKSC